MISTTFQAHNHFVLSLCSLKDSNPVVLFDLRICADIPFPVKHVRTNPTHWDLGRYAGNCDDGRGGFAEHTNVGSYVPNAYGLYDMLGNVGEFVMYIVRSSPTRTYDSKNYSNCSSYFTYVGKGKGDYEQETYYDYNGYGERVSYTRYYYKFEGTYVFDEIPHYLPFHGGNFSSEAAILKATGYTVNGQSQHTAPSYPDVSFDNLDKQIYPFDAQKIYLLTGGAQNGFRLYCDAE